MKEKIKTQKGFMLFELHWRVILAVIIFFTITILIIFMDGDIEKRLIALAFLIIIGIPTYYFGKKLIEELKKP